MKDPAAPDAPCPCRLLRRREAPESPGTLLEVLARGRTPDRRTFWICRCCECGQPFLRLRVEVPVGGGAPEEWNYWVPVEPDEADQLRHHPERAEALVRSRSRIVADPRGRLYWDLEISRPREPEDL